MRVIGMLLVLLPMAWWGWDVHHDPCGLQGDAWQQCRADHAPHTPHSDEAWATREDRQRLRALLTAEADRAERGEVEQ